MSYVVTRVQSARNTGRGRFPHVQHRNSGSLNLNTRTSESHVARTELESESEVTSIVCAIVLVSLTLGCLVGYGIARSL